MLLSDLNPRYRGADTGHDRRKASWTTPSVHSGISSKSSRISCAASRPMARCSTSTRRTPTTSVTRRRQLIGRPLHRPGPRRCEGRGPARPRTDRGADPRTSGSFERTPRRRRRWAASLATLGRQGGVLRRPVNSSNSSVDRPRRHRSSVVGTAGPVPRPARLAHRAREPAVHARGGRRGARARHCGQPARAALHRPRRLQIGQRPVRASRRRPARSPKSPRRCTVRSGSTDAIGRLGGDEFVVVCTPVTASASSTRSPTGSNSDWRAWPAR